MHGSQILGLAALAFWSKVCYNQTAEAFSPCALSSLYPTSLIVEQSTSASLSAKGARREEFRLIPSGDYTAKIPYNIAEKGDYAAFLQRNHPQ
jgi:hypothetical protein